MQGLIVPAYFNDINGARRPDWDRLAVAAQCLGERLIIILNPGSGPGAAHETLPAPTPAVAFPP